ncbi:hypothetical protein PI125_g26981, partial [Phytophthora idaei]
MVKLFCAIVGVAGSAFEVDIDEGQKVGDLKKAIKDQSDGLITDPWPKLQLFLSKVANGAWLDGAGVAAVTLEKAAGSAVPVLVDDHGNRHDFVKMDPLLWIKNDQHFGANFQPGEGQVHVLVVVPEQGTSAPIVSEGGVFDRCSDPFFSKFQTVYQVGDWLEFSSLLPLTKRQRLYIR